MAAEIYKKLCAEDFPMTVIQTGSLYENTQFIAESKADFSPFGYANIKIIEKNKRLTIF